MTWLRALCFHPRGMLLPVAIALLAAVLAYVFLLKPKAEVKPPVAAEAPKEDKKKKAGTGGGAAGAGAGAGSSGPAAGKGQSVAQLLKTVKKAGAALPKHPQFLRSVKGGGADTTCFGAFP